MKKPIKIILALIILVLVVIIGFLLMKDRNGSVLDDVVEKMEDVDVGVMRNKFVLLDDVGIQVKKGENIITALKAEGFNFVHVSHDEKDYVDEFDYFLLQKENKVFVYNKATSNMHEVEDFNIPSGWKISARRSATVASDFFVSMILSEDTEIGIPRIIKQNPYFLDAKNKEVMQASFGPAGFSQCFIFDSHNKRFLQWYCGEGIGSSAPIVVRKYSGEIISGNLSEDEYFSKEMKKGKFVKVEVQGVSGDLLIASELDEMSGQWVEKRSYDIKNDSLIVD